MAALKKRILQTICQTETENDDSSERNRDKSHPPNTATLILESKNRNFGSNVTKIRFLEPTTSQYPRLNLFFERLKMLKTLREYNEHLVQLTDRLILFRHHIDDCLKILVQHLFDQNDCLIQVALINTINTIHQRYPTTSTNFTNELLDFAKQTKSIKVISALLSYFSILPADALLDKNGLVRFALQYSMNIHVRAQLCAFKLLSTLARDTDLDASLRTLIIEKLLQVIDHDDARVRAEALRTIVDLFKCQVGLDSTSYTSFLECLQDYYPEVRLAACEALFLLAIHSPENLISSKTSAEESTKLINEIFSLICDLTNDEAKIVRVQAMKMIGKMCRYGVDINLIHQSLDKKLLRITKKKEFIAKVELLDSEGDDIAVHDVTVDVQSASIAAIGPCGALISGLEDEYSQVRAAAIDSCYDISCCHDVFQSKLVEYIVSMFDDDIEHVRLQAMRVLGKIAQGRVLRGEQVLSILTELLSRSYDIRSALHDVLRVVRIGDPETLLKLFHRLVENIQRFKTDSQSVLRCLRELGQNNSAFITLLLPKLLPMHNYLDVQEPQFSKIDHTCALIVVLNAAIHHPSILSVLPDYVFRHYQYLRTKEPELTPNLQQSLASAQISKTFDIDVPLLSSVRSSHDVFHRILQRSQQGQELNPRDRQKFYRNLAAELHKVSEMDNDLIAISECLSLYYEVLALITYQSNTQTSLKALSICKRLLTVFHGYNDVQLEFFQHLHLYCHLLLISQQTKLSNATRQRCLKHLEWQRQRKSVGEFEQMINEKCSLHNLINFAQRCIASMSKTVLFVEKNLVTAKDPIRMVAVSFLEPDADLQQILDFLPGLSVSIPCLMNAKNLEREQNLNIKVTYLDGQFCLLPINDENIRTLAEDSSLRIDSKVTFSHQHWLRPCEATFSAVLFPMESRCFTLDLNEEFVEITRRIRVLLHPKYLRHRLRKKQSLEDQSTMSATTVEQVELPDDEHETEWYDETAADEEEMVHLDDDELEMDTSQDEDQQDPIEPEERRANRDSDDDDEMSH